MTDLNQLRQRPPKEYVFIKGDQFKDTELTVETRSSLADHPLVVGPRYQAKDFDVKYVYSLDYHASGLSVFGIGEEGCRICNQLRRSNFLRTYEIRCKFGRATRDFFSTGRTVEKTSFSKLSLTRMSRLISKTVTSHRSMVHRSLGIDLHSQEAYELLAAGVTRPFSSETAPLLINLRLLAFKPPDFTLELMTVNEEEEFIGSLVHGLGLKMHTTACIESLRCTRFGFFTEDLGLVDPSLEQVIENIAQCKQHTSQDKVSPVSPNIGQDDPKTRLLKAVDDEKFLITKYPLRR